MSVVGEKLSNYSLEETIDTINGIREIGAGLAEGRGSTGSKIGDLALGFCIQRNHYDKIKSVIKFWETLDGLVKENQGELVAMCIGRESLMLAGNLNPGDGGLVVRKGRPILPVERAFKHRPMSWEEIGSARFELGKGYETVSVSRHGDSGELGAYMLAQEVGVDGSFCRIAFGNESVKRLLEYEGESMKASFPHVNIFNDFQQKLEAQEQLA